MFTLYHSRVLKLDTQAHSHTQIKTICPNIGTDKNSMINLLINLSSEHNIEKVDMFDWLKSEWQRNGFCKGVMCLNENEWKT